MALCDRRRFGVVGFPSVSAPVALIGTGFGIEDDNATVAVSVGDVNFAYL